MTGSGSGETPSGGVGDLARLFARLGFTAFGGPAAHISMMHDEVVTRRAWLDDQRFMDLIGVTNLIPGPNSTEMAMHVGHERAGWRGLIAAGASFILPAALIVLAFAWAYVEYGDTPSGQAILYGVKPVVVMIIAQALLKLGRSAVKGWLTAFIGISATVAYLLGVNELILLAAGGGIVLILRTTIKPGLLGVAPLTAGWIAAQIATAGEIPLGRLFLVFLKAGAFLYGSGYALLAFLQSDLVDRLSVLTQDQLLDAIAIGQFTPGPVFTTATFIGLRPRRHPWSCPRHRCHLPPVVHFRRSHHSNRPTDQRPGLDRRNSRRSQRRRPRPHGRCHHPTLHRRHHRPAHHRHRRRHRPTPLAHPDQQRLARPRWSRPRTHSRPG